MGEPRMRASTSAALGLVDAALKSAGTPAVRGGAAVVAVDAKRTRMNELHRRMDATMEGEAIQGLVSSFLAVGQQQEVKGWRLPAPEADGTEYVLMYGARRRAAAIQAGIELKVEVVPKPSDEELMVAMLAENDERLNYLPLEQGREWKAIIDRGLYPTAKALAARLKKDDDRVQRCVALASLPKEILSLYTDPRWMQLVQGLELVQAYQAGGEIRERLLKKAAELAHGPTGKDPTRELLGTIRPPAPGPAASRYMFNKKEVARAVIGKRGTGEIRITMTSAAPEKVRHALLEVLEKSFQKGKR